LMVLDAWRFTRNETALRRYLPIVVGIMEFYMNYAPAKSNSIIFYPTQALETYWCPFPFEEDACVTNDAPTIAATVSLSARILSLPRQFLDPTFRQRLAAWSAALPLLPSAGTPPVLQPAEKFRNYLYNSETPELYPVHPFRYISIARLLADQNKTDQHAKTKVETHHLQKNASTATPTLKQYLDMAIGAWQADPRAHSNSGWNQGIMNAALLGLANEAWAYIVQRASVDPPRGYRFLGFAPHMQDYEPSADHYANMMSALQLMLVVPADQDLEGDGGEDKIVIFPAWPCHLDVEFKLHAPANTIIIAQYSAAQKKIVRLDIDPPTRRSSVIIGLNCSSA